MKMRMQTFGEIEVEDVRYDCSLLPLLALSALSFLLFFLRGFFGFNPGRWFLKRGSCYHCQNRQGERC